MKSLIKGGINSVKYPKISISINIKLTQLNSKLTTNHQLDGKLGPFDNDDKVGGGVKNYGCDDHGGGDDGGGDVDDGGTDGGGKRVSAVALVFQESRERRRPVRSVPLSDELQSICTDFPQTG